MARGVSRQVKLPVTRSMDKIPDLVMIVKKTVAVVGVVVVYTCFSLNQAAFRHWSDYPVRKTADKMLTVTLPRLTTFQRALNTHLHLRQAVTPLSAVEARGVIMKGSHCI
ncbi:hypothetical protein HanRHA438_Chr06g0272791 [Helianthus annuus]|nr:hypothetical protein HanRHA438_Chr06g0272791 [Helianthus annuus]